MMPCRSCSAGTPREEWSDDHGGYIMRPVPVEPKKQTEWTVEPDEDADVREEAARAVKQEEDQPRQQEIENATAESVGLRLPEHLEPEHAEEGMAWLDGLAPIAAEAGIAAEETNQLVSYTVDLIQTDRTGHPGLDNEAACRTPTVSASSARTSTTRSCATRNSRSRSWGRGCGTSSTRTATATTSRFCRAWPPGSAGTRGCRPRKRRRRSAR
jgi:hypothetical protein